MIWVSKISSYRSTFGYQYCYKDLWDPCFNKWLIYLGCSPLPATVTTRIFSLLFHFLQGIPVNSHLPLLILERGHTWYRMLIDTCCIHAFNICTHVSTTLKLTKDLGCVIQRYGFSNTICSTRSDQWQTNKAQIMSVVVLNTINLSMYTPEIFNSEFIYPWISWMVDWNLATLSQIGASAKNFQGRLLLNVRECRYIQSLLGCSGCWFNIYIYI